MFLADINPTWSMIINIIIIVCNLLLGYAGGKSGAKSGVNQQLNGKH